MAENVSGGEKESRKKPTKELKKSRVWEIQSHIKDTEGNDLFTPEMIETYLFSAFLAKGTDGVMKIEVLSREYAKISVNRISCDKIYA